jgi:hypothetical protein
MKLCIVDIETSINEAFQLCEKHYSYKEVSQKLSLDKHTLLKSDQKIVD